MNTKELESIYYTLYDGTPECKLGYRVINTPEGKFAQWVLENYNEEILNLFIMHLIGYALHDSDLRDHPLIREWEQSKVNA